jgi:uncharacterized protein
MCFRSHLVRTIHVVLWATLLLASHAFAALQPIPPLSSSVTDLTSTLSAQQQLSLTNKLSQFSKEKGSQIAVLIVPTTQPEDIAQYSIRVAEAWKIGRDKQDDGVIILIAKDDHKMRIEVGYGLEGAIPDLVAKRVISEIMAPHFKQGDFYGGLDLATDKLISLILGENLPEPQKSDGQINDLFSMLPMIMFGAIITGMILRSIFGTFVGSALNGGLVGILVWVFGAAFFAIALSAFAGFMFTLVLGSRGINGYGHYPGGFGGGGLGNGGFGGHDVFTGGGGDFGGGGASGDW